VTGHRMLVHCPVCGRQVVPPLTAHRCDVTVEGPDVESEVAASPARGLALDGRATPTSHPAVQPTPEPIAMEAS